MRCASSFAAIRSDLVAHAIKTIDVAAPGRVLVACGSVTAASTAQLDALKARGAPVVTVDHSSDRDQVVADARACLAEGGLVVVMTPRDRTGDGSLASGAVLMDRLADTVGALGSDADLVIAKGGITSARMGIALGAEQARVEGQVAPGVALWTLRSGDTGTLPFVVVPGNVGGDRTLVDVLDRVRVVAASRKGGRG